MDKGDVIKVIVSLGKKMPISVSPEDYFTLQRLTFLVNISQSDVLDYFKIDESFCSITKDGVEDGYQKSTISFPSYFFEEEGTTYCELYSSLDSSKKSIVFFYWEPNRQYVLNDIYSNLLNNGYIEKDSLMTYLLECENGAIEIMNYRNGKCKLTISAYYVLLKESNENPKIEGVEDTESGIDYEIIEGCHLNLEGKGKVLVERISDKEIKAQISLTNVCDFSIVLEKNGGMYMYDDGICWILFAYVEGYNLIIVHSGQVTEKFPYWDEMSEVFENSQFALGG